MITELSVFHFLLAGIALVFIVNGGVRYFRGEYRQTFVRFVLGFTIWVLVLVFGLFPGASHAISRWLGFGQNLNTLIFFGFVVLFIACFKLLSMVERLERSITEIVRKEALDSLKKREGQLSSGADGPSEIKPVFTEHERPH